MLSEDTLARANTATLMRLIQQLVERGAVARSSQCCRIFKTAASGARGSMMPSSSSVESLCLGSRGQQNRLIQEGGAFDAPRYPAKRTAHVESSNEQIENKQASALAKLGPPCLCLASVRAQSLEANVQ